MARKYCVNFTMRYYKNARQKREGNGSGGILGTLLLLSAAEAANDAFPNYCCLSWIVGLSHARSEARQFLAGEFSFRVELIGKSNDAQLIFRIETLDLFDYLSSSHDLMLTQTAPTFNLAC